MEKIQNKIKLSLAIILASLFFQNCTAWPALTALLALAGGDDGGALLLVPPGGGGGSGAPGAAGPTPDTTLERLEITPSVERLPRGATATLQARAIYSDARSIDVTSQADWQALTTESIAIQSKGVVKALDNAETKDANIEATFEGVKAEAIIPITAEELLRVEFHPTSLSIPHDEFRHFQVTAVYTNGGVDLTSRSNDGEYNLSTNDASIASIGIHEDVSGVTKKRANGINPNLDGTNPTLSTNLTATYKGVSASLPVTVNPAVVLVNLRVSPKNPDPIVEGEHQQFRAYAIYSDSSEVEVTNTAVWSSSASGQISVYTSPDVNPGQARAITSGGNVTITATYNGISDTATISSISCSLTQITVTPSSTTLATPDLTQNYTASGTYSNCSPRDITNNVVWNSSVAGVATISNTDPNEGRATTVGPGTTNITATASGITSNTATLTVSPATITSVVLSPSNPSVPLGTSQQITATANYNYGSSSNITNQIVWESSNTSILTVSNAEGSEGLITATGTTTGTATLTARLNGEVVATMTITITNPILTRLAFSTTSISIPNGLNSTHSVTSIELIGHYSNGTTQNLTMDGGVTYSSSNSDVAVFDPNNNRVTTSNVGTTTLSATKTNSLGTVISTATSSPNGNLVVTVTSAVIVGLRISPDPITPILQGTNRVIQAFATYSDSTELEVTNSAIWTSSSDLIGQIETAGGGKRIFGVSAGTFDLTASYSGFSSNVDGIQVWECNLTAITLDPTSHTFSGAGQELQFTATGSYSFTSGGTVSLCPVSQNVSTTAVWSSANSDIITVSNDGSNKGTVTSGSTAGTTDLIATIGSVTGQASVTVNILALNSIAITPNTATLNVDSSQSFTATGTYSDGSTANITNLVTWSTSDSDIATISNGSMDKGLLSGVSMGTVTATATLGSVSGTSGTITIEGDDVPPTLVEIISTGKWDDNTKSYVRVRYSEPVKVDLNGTGSANNTTNWKVAFQTALSGSCAAGTLFANSPANSDFGIDSIVVNSSSDFTIRFNGLTNERNYTIIASPSIQDVAGNNTGCPNSLNFQGQDNTPPYLVSATSIGKNEVLVTYSEPVTTGAGNTTDALLPSNYVVTVDPAGQSCINGTPPAVNSVEQLSSTEFMIRWTSWEQCDIRYRIQVSTDIRDTSAEANPMGSPNSLTWLGNEAVRMLTAESTGLNTIRVVFSKPVRIDTACNITAECQDRFKIPSALGVVTQAVVSPAPQNFVVTLTHSIAQGGSSYTVIGANGLDGDGFDNIGKPFESIRSTGAVSTNLMSQPRDRASFMGSGTVITDFAGGAFFTDPFQDDTSFSFTFNYDNRIYLGTNNINTSAFRFNPAGDNSILTTFRFPGSTKKGFGCVYDETFNPACVGDLVSGPSSEYGVVGFTSLRFNFSGDIREGLFVGTLKDGADRLYYTEDKDAELTWSNIGFSATGGGNTKSVQMIGSHNHKVYIGLSSSHGQQAPVVAHHTASIPGGNLSISAGSDLSFRSLNLIGKNATGGGSIKNPCTYTGCVVGIDKFFSLPSAIIPSTSSGLFVANNGGLVYSSSSAPTSDSDFTSVLNLTKSARGNTTLSLPTVANGGLEKVSPGFRGVPEITTYKGKMYLIRNLSVDENNLTNITTRNGGELWKCSTACATGSNWSMVFRAQDLPGGTNNLAFSMLQVNGKHLYIGVDNNAAGIRVFRTTTAIGNNSSGEITAASNFEQQGLSGLNVAGLIVKRIMSYTSILVAGNHYIYVVAGDDSAPVALRAFRQIDSAN